MKKQILSLALALVMALSLAPKALAAETDEPRRGVLTYSEIIAPQYEDAQVFCEGLAAVKKDGKWGYIDTTGQVVIPFQYDQAYHFNEGKALVGTANGQSSQGSYYFRAGFLDKSGRYTPLQTTDGLAVYYESDTRAVTDEFEYVFHNGYITLPVVLYYGENALFGPDGREVKLIYEGAKYPAIPLNYPVNEGFVSTLEGYYELSSHRILSVELDKETYPDWFVYSYYPFNQGLAGVWIAKWDEQAEKMRYALGFADTSGAWVIQPFLAGTLWIDTPETTYQLFGSTGLAMIRDTDGNFGAIDKTGRTVIPFRYEDLRIEGDGLIAFRENGKYGYLDAGDLSVVIPAQYENTTGFENGLAAVYDGSKVLLIDREGSPVPGGDKLKASTYFTVLDDGATSIHRPEEYVVIEEDGKYGYGHIEYLRPLPERDELDEWAYDEVVAAIENGLVPGSLQNLYRNDIRRGEFCGVVVQTLEAALDKDIAEIVKDKTGGDLQDYQNSYPFVDTTDLDTLAASKLGIVNGRGNGVFDPYASITRQEAAAMLMRAAKVLDMKNDGSGNTVFADSSQVASWAEEAVEYICRAGIMNGRGDVFDPGGSYSREQSYMTVYRLFLRVVE